MRYLKHPLIPEKLIVSPEDEERGWVPFAFKWGWIPGTTRATTPKGKPCIEELKPIFDKTFETIVYRSGGNEEEYYKIPIGG